MTIKTLPNGNTEGFNTYTTSMVPEQPEALRLAHLLEEEELNWWDRKAADELRRLHDLLGKSRALNRIRAERIKELEQALGMAVEALEFLYGWTHDTDPVVDEALATARQTLGGAA